jgi:predicted AAA+ superfamily ATPase
MLQRRLAPQLEAALADRPVVLLHGARQTGKTTLARASAAARNAAYYTLDAAAVFAAANADPEGFVAGMPPGPVVVDEVQRAPGLFSALKQVVDRDRAPGRFLLTGSASALMVPRLSESLAGRMELLTLWPLAQCEIEGTAGDFVDRLLADEPLVPAAPGATLASRLVRGGYPEVATGATDRADAWFGSYLTTILQRDVRDLAAIEDLSALPRLLRLLAARTAGLLNYAGLSRDSGIPQSTLKRYFALLEATFLVRTLPPWHGSIGQRLVKSPKVMLADSGLAAHLLGADETRLAGSPELMGRLLEAFVAMEVERLMGWAGNPAALYHFRTRTGSEVDLVLETRDGRVAGIEVKASSSVSAADVAGLKALATAAGPRFVRGVILYAGQAVVPFGPRLHAVPLSTLWA